jgi:hypothetical protein
MQRWAAWASLPTTGPLASGGTSIQLGRVAPGRSGDQAVDNHVDCEVKPLIGIASAHLRGVAGEKREAMDASPAKVSWSFVDLLAGVAIVAAGRGPPFVLTRHGRDQGDEDVARQRRS